MQFLDKIICESYHGIMEDKVILGPMGLIKIMLKDENW